MIWGIILSPGDGLKKDAFYVCELIWCSSTPWHSPAVVRLVLSLYLAPPCLRTLWKLIHVTFDSDNHKTLPAISSLRWSFACLFRLQLALSTLLNPGRWAVCRFHFHSSPRTQYNLEQMAVSNKHGLSKYIPGVCWTTEGFFFGLFMIDMYIKVFSTRW